MNIYVGNLAIETTADELKQVFSVFGEVQHVIVMNDGNTNRHKDGVYGYIEMTMKSEGAAAINGLNGTMINGRAITAIVALPLSAKRIEIPSRRMCDGPLKVRK